MPSYDIDLIPNLISNFLKKIRKAQNEMLINYHLSSIHMMYLMVLYRNLDGLTLNNLNDLLNVDKANTTRVVKDLIKKGYLEKDEKGIRKYKVKLTEEGIIVTKKVKKNSAYLQAKVKDILNEEEQLFFIKILLKINDVEL